jgi:monovalent cation:H+ antiporter-2, CPA2 family
MAREPLLVLAALGIVMIAKPLAAVVIVAIIGYPARTGLTVGLGLAQIGEFSFILSELGRQHGLMGEAGHNVLVAAAIVSITANPLLFRLMGPLERALQRSPRVWAMLNRRAGERQQHINEEAARLLETGQGALAVILGYGPVGRSVDSILRTQGVETVVVDININTVESLTRAGRAAIYGDAYNIEVLTAAMARATHLIITLPHMANRTPLIAAAKLINPHVKVFVRAHYVAERHDLEQAGADAACYEEAEAAVALGRLVLKDQGADEQTVRRETIRIRQRFAESAGR